MRFKELLQREQENEVLNSVRSRAFELGHFQRMRSEIALRDGTDRELDFCEELVRVSQEDLRIAVEEASGLGFGVWLRSLPVMLEGRSAGIRNYENLLEKLTQEAYR